VIAASVPAGHHERDGSLREGASGDAGIDPERVRFGHLSEAGVERSDATPAERARSLGHVRAMTDRFVDNTG
jgi:hypothetical protein